LALLAVGGLLTASAVAVFAQDKGAPPCPPAPMKVVQRAMQATPSVVEEGRQAYQASCASCHGQDGRGNGPQANSLPNRPTNLREGLKATSAGSLFTALTAGHTSADVGPVYALDAQARWSIVHFVRADLLASSSLTDTSAAELGAACGQLNPGEQVICRAEVKKDLDSKLNATPEQLTRGAELYSNNCSSCHGPEGKADGPAAVALDPKPRNLAKDDFKAGSSAFALFNTVTNGLAGTSMPGFDSLAEADRWAIVHHLRGKLIPEDRQEKATPEQVQTLCIELSRPPKANPLPIDVAMAALAEDQEGLRNARWTKYGAVRLNATGDEKLGEALYGAMCANCHGDSGQGMAALSREGRFPFVTMHTRPMTNQAAGGNWREFTGRVLSVHETLPSLVAAGTFTENDLKSLQAYLGKGLRRVAKIESDEPRTTPVALMSATNESELLFYSGAVYRLDHATGDDGAANLHRIYGYAEFKEAYRGSTVLPEVQPDDGVEVAATMGLDCLREPDDDGNRTFCTTGNTSGGREITVKLKLAAAAAP